MDALSDFRPAYVGKFLPAAVVFRYLLGELAAGHDEGNVEHQVEAGGLSVGRLPGAAFGRCRSGISAFEFFQDLGWPVGWFPVVVFAWVVAAGG
jgi:hypothetical protein